ncbi:MAG TPA: hypothetical protein PK765_02635 [bacterium]|nr:hypothetical protein [bacterium]
MQAKDGKNKIERAERAIRMIAVRLLHGNARRFIEDDPALPGMEFDPEMMVFTTLRTLAHEAAPNDRAAVFAELYATILCLIRETSCKSSRMRFA